jgi:hypothetical protein
MRQPLILKKRRSLYYLLLCSSSEPNVIKKFTNVLNKLECLSLASLFSLINVSVIPGAYPEHLKGALRQLALFANIRLDC